MRENELLKKEAHLLEEEKKNLNEVIESLKAKLEES